MAYVCELGDGQRLYLDNSGTQTLITLSSSSAGQQQQSSQSFETGNWLAPPDVSRLWSGIIVTLKTEQGDRFIQVQGNYVGILQQPPSLDHAQPLQLQQTAPPPVTPMQPMQPMQPMKMGDMQMSLNPMSMRMGNMSMQMGTPPESSRRFCSQCGASIQADDRFCSNCGHRLNPSG